MTERSVPEWIGRKPETPIPLRVKLRVLRRQEHRCAQCTREFDGKLLAEFDHRPALITGGENRESKIEAVCGECHLSRTFTDTKAKAHVAAIRARHLGLKANQSRPMPGTRASAWKHKMDGSWERRSSLAGEPEKLQAWGEACATRVQELMKGRKK